MKDRFFYLKEKICSFQERQSWVFEAWVPFATGDVYWGRSGSNCTSVINDHITFTRFQKCYYGFSTLVSSWATCAGVVLLSITWCCLENEIRLFPFLSRKASMADWCGSNAINPITQWSIIILRPHQHTSKNDYIILPHHPSNFHIQSHCDVSSRHKFPSKGSISHPQPPNIILSVFRN